YPPEAFEFSPPTDEQVTRAIRKLKPYKAPGADGLPNAVWIRCATLVAPWLGTFFRATFTLEHIPLEWKDSVTAIL
ncbi:hypothetical protein BV25DRAFT_1766066, partial [Artomyces pyxidatus]